MIAWLRRMFRHPVDEGERDRTRTRLTTGTQERKVIRGRLDRLEGEEREAEKERDDLAHRLDELERR